MEKKLILDNISFHDCKVYAFGYDEKNNQFLLDVDYISSEWILEKNGYYSFNIVPSTFVFENAWDIEINISMGDALIIDEITRDNPKLKNFDGFPENTKEYDWKIEFLQGEINFKSISFSIYQRQKEITQKSRLLTMDDRRGISLQKEGTIYQIN
jgi:hypothetical protein